MMRKSVVFCLLLVAAALSVQAMGGSDNGKAKKPAPKAQMTAHLPVQQNEFVSVFMGSEPGRMMTLRVEREQNETVVLFQPPSEHTSRTFVQYDNMVEGNELMFVGAHSMRVPVTINPEARRADTSVQHDGALGLGKNSELWRYWSRFTLSSSDLVLGANDRSLERQNFKGFELHMGPDQMIKTPMKPTKMPNKGKPDDVGQGKPDDVGQDRPFEVHFRPTEMQTSVPSDLFFELLNSTERKNGRVPPFVLHLPSQASNGKPNKMIDVEIKDDEGESTLKRNPKDKDNQIILGCGACRNFVWHTDRLRNTHVIAPAYDAFDAGNSQPWFNIVASLLFIVQYYFWYAIAYTEHVKLNNPQSLVISVLEQYTYAACLGFIVIMDSGFEVKRFVDFQVSYTRLASYELLLGILLFALVSGWILSYFTFKEPNYLTVRKILFEMVVTLCFWLTQLETHYTGLQQVFLIALASIHAVTRSISLFWCFAENEPTKPYKILLVAVATVVAHWFLICFNIIPFVSRYWYGFPSEWSSVLLVWLVCAGLPSLLVFFGLISAEIANDFIKLDDTMNK